MISKGGNRQDPESQRRYATLTPREREVLTAMTSGRTYEEAAADMGIRPHTFSQYTATVRYKLGVANRAEAAAWAVRYGAD